MILMKDNNVITNENTFNRLLKITKLREKWCLSLSANLFLNAITGIDVIVVGTHTGPTSSIRKT